jgi:hypothetical protein
MLAPGRLSRGYFFGHFGIKLPLIQVDSPVSLGMQGLKKIKAEIQIQVKAVLVFIAIIMIIVAIQEFFLN